VQDRVTGVLVQQRDPQRLADALRCLLRDGRLRAQVAAVARALVERWFDERRNAEQLRSIFHAVTAVDAPAGVA
ncbi:MAG: hypothetical protein ACRD2X_04220, partial [Vicinamibacteraceae bacterium]